MNITLTYSVRETIGSSYKDVPIEVGFDLPDKPMCFETEADYNDYIVHLWDSIPKIENKMLYFKRKDFFCISCMEKYQNICIEKGECTFPQPLMERVGYFDSL
jgi:hypothetical protein